MKLINEVHAVLTLYKVTSHPLSPQPASQENGNKYQKNIFMLWVLKVLYFQSPQL
jgi:hypothetical protein